MFIDTVITSTLDGYHKMRNGLSYVKPHCELCVTTDLKCENTELVLENILESHKHLKIFPWMSELGTYNKNCDVCKVRFKK